jgi:hypothetical protein
MLFNLSTATPVTTQYTPTDGTKDGLLGNMFRAKFTTTGTYAGNTTVRKATASCSTTISAALSPMRKLSTRMRVRER